MQKIKSKVPKMNLSKKAPNRSCFMCGTMFYARPSKESFLCSTECVAEYFRTTKACVKNTASGESHYRWNGGVTWGRGYKMILIKDHPKANKDGYVYEHRYIMEQSLGRFLTEDEVVHHKDLNPLNNNIENLLLLENESEHRKEHTRINNEYKEI